MIRDSELKLGTVIYHRNGVSGEGFHTVCFKNRLGRKWLDMHAVIYETEGQCSVLLNSDVNERWRGDDFEPKLRKHIETTKEGLNP